MYILHSLNVTYTNLMNEVSHLYTSFGDEVPEMWFLVNLDFCKDDVEEGMYVSGLTEKALELPLDEDGQEYSYLVLVNRDKDVLLGRYGSFNPELESPKTYYWNDMSGWIYPKEIQELDETLYQLLTPLWH